MQTFLPYESFSRSAQVLDYRRLGKQRVECKQIVLALSDPAYGWQNHPAVRMWRGYEPALAMYGATMCREWRRRGYNDSLLPFFDEIVLGLGMAGCVATMPTWLGQPEFHLSHQSNLVRKDPVHYRQYFPDVPPDLPYIWPSGCVSVLDTHGPKAPIEA